MLMFVAIRLNQFTKRYTSTDSTYEYTVQGLGPNAGSLSGWCLIWAYLFIGVAGVSGFTHSATKLLDTSGARGYWSHPMLTVFADYRNIGSDLMGLRRTTKHERERGSEGISHQKHLLPIFWRLRPHKSCEIARYRDGLPVLPQLIPRGIWD